MTSALQKLDKRTHSRFGGSKAKTFLLCNASASGAPTPDVPPTQEIDEGRAAHRLIELCINFGHECEDFVSRHIGRVEVTPEMAEACAPMVERARAYVAAGAKVYVEHEIALTQFDAELRGHVDLIAYFPETRLLKVEEFKYGAGIYVRVVRNHQLMFYGLGAMLTLGVPVREIELTVDQPRCDRGEGNPRTWKTDSLDLLEFGAELVAAVCKARSANPTFVVGEHCYHCDRRGFCDTFRDAALRGAGADLEPHSGSFMPPVAPELMSLNELGRRLEQAELIRSWLNGLKAFAYGEMLRGRIATGHKAIQKEGRRRWKDAALAAAQAPRVYTDLQPEQMFQDPKPVSPAQFEKIVGKKHAADFLKEYVERPKSLRLVRTSDPGEAVAVGALSDFADIIELEEGTDYEVHN